MLAVANIGTMQAVVSESVAERRVTMAMLLVFAASALLPAGIGIYGVIAYTVTPQTREIGIRMALGAARGTVLRMVVRRALGLAVAGIVMSQCFLSFVRFPGCADTLMSQARAID